MSSNSNVDEDMDFLPIHEMLIRWQLASDYVNDLEVSEKLGTAALRTLIDRDVPLLFVALRNHRIAGWEKRAICAYS